MNKGELMNSKKQSVAILVSDKWKKTHHIDDVLLQKKLEEKNVSCDILSWRTSPKIFSEYKCAIIRSCWDYHENRDAFLRQIFEIEKRCLLINDYNTVRENSEKTYLKTLSEQNIPVVPTLYAKTKDEVNALSIPNHWTGLVLKPTVSASGMNTHRFLKETGNEWKKKAEELVEKGSIMIQDYYESIQEKGERSLIVIDGKVCIAIKKMPPKDGFLIHNHHGGYSVPDEITETDCKFVQNLISKIDKNPAYMRVDLLYSNSGEFHLLELELIEPGLYLKESPQALESLANLLTKI